MLKRFLMGGAVVAPLLAAAIGHTAELPIAGAYGSTTVCEIYRAADADAVFHDGMDPKTGEIVPFTSSDDDLPFALFLPDRLVGVEQDCQFLDVRGEKVTILCEYEWGTGNHHQRRREQAGGMSSRENHGRGASWRGQYQCSRHVPCRFCRPQERMAVHGKVWACQCPSPEPILARRAGHPVDVGLRESLLGDAGIRCHQREWGHRKN